jgi:hypothetical protein
MKTWIASEQKLKHINGWSKKGAGGHIKIKNGIMSPAGSGKEKKRDLKNEQHVKLDGTKTRG